MTNIVLTITNEQVAPALQKAHDMPAAADVAVLAKYPLAPVHPQINKVTQGIVVCFFDGTDKKVIHMTDNLGVIESYNANTVSAANATNQGGASLNRVTSSQVATSATVGILTPRSISSSVPLYNISNTAYDISVGRTSDSNTSTTIRTEKATALSPTITAIGFGDRNAYDMTTGKIVNFWVKNKAKISVWCGSGETLSNSVRIDVNRDVDGTSPFYDLTGQTGRYEIEIPNVGIDGYISIGNFSANKCYIMGVNITPIQLADSNENYDSFTAWYHNDFIDGGFYWIGTSNGANDFALRASGAGRVIFGSFHGGHSNEVLTFVNGRETIDSASFIDTEFNYGRTITFKSVSDLTDSVVTGDCVQEVTFFQGGHRINSTVNLDTPTAMANMYTGMTCTNKRFNQVTLPIVANIDDGIEGDETQLGQVASCVQYDPINDHTVETQTTWYDHTAVARDGMYILNRVATGDKKAYFDSMVDSDKTSSGFNAITYHLFNS